MEGIMKFANRLVETNMVPDAVVRRGVRLLLAGRLKELRKPTLAEEQKDLMDFVKYLKTQPIATHTPEANEQHYEVPTEFYKLVLGKNLKYSSCIYKDPNSSLDQAEDDTLELYCERARLAPGQRVLELGCGWGSLSLFMAAKYPGSTFVGVSNSSTQRQHIEEQCRKRGITNLTIITADMNVFQADGQFDRIVSIEMFEHMSNYEALNKKVASWLKPEGFLFIHIFTHKQYAYKFEVRGEGDWMAKYFFTGGTMPSDNLMLYFTDDLAVVDHWREDGTNYGKTSGAWLANMDARIADIRPIFEATYGKENVTKWIVYWRLFFIAVEECFNYDNGREWIVTHMLFRKRG
eukprot:jgi/Mesvir1/10671/Mv13763-RA.1